MRESHRVFKAAYSHAGELPLIRSECGKHFDLAIESRFAAIRRSMGDGMPGSSYETGQAA